MDNQTQLAQPVQTTKPISDDQELAKVLAGITKDNNMGFEETPSAPKPAENVPIAPPMPPAPFTMPAMPTNDSSAANQSNDDVKMPDMNTPAPATNLESIRKDALIELRPLVDKLDLAPEEKFDIYLLLLRSTDDTALIAPAHEAAKNIANESKRAEALLDVIKEIDFLSVPAQV